MTAGHLQGHTPLHIAVWTSIDRVSILLQHGAKVNVQDSQVWAYCRCAAG